MRFYAPLSPEESARLAKDVDALTDAGWQLARILHKLGRPEQTIGPLDAPAPIFIRQAAGLQTNEDSREAIKELLSKVTR